MAAEPAENAAQAELYFHGRVLDFDTGAPIEGARVLFIEDYDGSVSASLFSQIAPFAERLTGSDGIFEFRGKVPEGATVNRGEERFGAGVSLFVEKAGYIEYQSGYYDRMPTVGEKAQPDIQLTRGIPITGTVSWENGERVQCGVVSFSGRGDSEQVYVDGKRLPEYVSRPRFAFIDDCGEFRAHFPAGAVKQLSIAVAGADWLYSTVTVTTTEHDFQFSVHAFPVLWGKAIDPAGVGVAGVEIHVGSALRDVTDENGAFSVPWNPDTASIPLEVRHPDYATEIHTVATLDAEVVFRLRAARHLIAQFENSRGRAVCQSWLLLTTNEGRFELRPDGQAGSYRSGPLSPESNGGKVEIPGFRPVTLRWPEGSGDHDLGRVRLTVGNLAMVCVHDAAGNPIEGACVIMSSAIADVPSVDSVATDEDGVALVGGLRPALYEVFASHDGFLPAHAQFDVSESSGAELKVFLRRGGMVRLRAITASGHPVPGATIEPVAAGADGNKSLWIADRNGVAELTHLETHSAQAFIVDSPDHAPTFFAVDPLEPEEVRDLGDIALSAGGTLHGVVEGHGGKPMPHAWVELSGSKCRSSSTQTVDSTADGEFTFGGLGGGKYRLSVTPRDCMEPGLFDSEASISELLAIPASGTLEVFVTLYSEDQTR